MAAYLPVMACLAIFTRPYLSAMLYSRMQVSLPDDPFPIVLPILQLPTLAFSPRVLLELVSFLETDAP